jgi:hypothetical protein
VAWIAGFLAMIVLVGVTETLKEKGLNIVVSFVIGWVAAMVIGSAAYLALGGEPTRRNIDPDVAAEEYCTPSIAC